MLPTANVTTKDSLCAVWRQACHLSSIKAHDRTTEVRQ
jgi:hypothetical protein